MSKDEIFLDEHRKVALACCCKWNLVFECLNNGTSLCLLFITQNSGWLLSVCLKNMRMTISDIRIFVI